MSVSNADSVVTRLRAGAVTTVQFNIHFDVLTVATDGSADVAITTNGATPVAGSGSQVLAANMEGSFACPAGAAPITFKATSTGSPQISVCQGNSALTRPPRAVHGKNQADT